MCLLVSYFELAVSAIALPSRASILLSSAAQVAKLLSNLLQVICINLETAENTSLGIARIHNSDRNLQDNARNYCIYFVSA